MAWTFLLLLPFSLQARAASSVDDPAADGLSEDSDEGWTDDALGPIAAPDPLAQPIINGEPASESDYPQAGAMIIDADLDLGSYGSGTIRSMVCSSTLIAPDVVMLAGHCLDEYAYTQGLGTMEINEIRWSRAADLTSIDGTHRRADWPEDSISAIDWVQHEDFSLRTMEIGIAENYDVALLFLDTAVTDTPFAYVPTEDEGDQLVEGEDVVIVGWGQQEATDYGETPASGTYAVKYMGVSPLGEIGDGEFQVGPNSDDVRKCHGDSGGPTFATIETDSTDTFRVVGITSHSYDYTDCKNKGGVDTRVMFVRDWIEAEMIARCEDGTRVWCEEAGLPQPPLPEPEKEDLADNGDEEKERRFGCGCSTVNTSSAFAPLAIGLAALALARRRRA